MGDAKVQEMLVKRLRAAAKANGRLCADCTEKFPGQVCMDFNTFVCMSCSGIHREFQHKCKGISMSKWTADEVKAIEKGGNLAAEKIWLAKWTSKEFPLPEAGDMSRIRKYIQLKYKDKKWYSATGDGAGSTAASNRSGDTPKPEPISNILKEVPNLVVNKSGAPNKSPPAPPPKPPPKDLLDFDTPAAPPPPGRPTPPPPPGKPPSQRPPPPPPGHPPPAAQQRQGGDLSGLMSALDIGVNEIQAPAAAPAGLAPVTGAPKVGSNPFDDFVDDEPVPVAAPATDGFGGGWASFGAEDSWATPHSNHVNSGNTPSAAPAQQTSSGWTTFADTPGTPATAGGVSNPFGAPTPGATAAPSSFPQPDGHAAAAQAATQPAAEQASQQPYSDPFADMVAQDTFSTSGMSMGPAGFMQNGTNNSALSSNQGLGGGPPNPFGTQQGGMSGVGPGSQFSGNPAAQSFGTQGMGMMGGNGMQNQSMQMVGNHQGMSMMGSNQMMGGMMGSSQGMGMMGANRGMGMIGGNQMQHQSMGAMGGPQGMGFNQGMGMIQGNQGMAFNQGMGNMGGGMGSMMGPNQSMGMMGSSQGQPGMGMMGGNQMGGQNQMGGNLMGGNQMAGTQMGGHHMPNQMQSQMQNMGMGMMGAHQGMGYNQAMGGQQGGAYNQVMGGMSGMGNSMGGNMMGGGQMGAMQGMMGGMGGSSFNDSSAANQPKPEQPQEPVEKQEEKPDLFAGFGDLKSYSKKSSAPSNSNTNASFDLW